MKGYLVLICGILSGSAASGQTMKTPLDKGFVEKTIEYYYTRQAQQHHGASVFFIEKDTINMHARTDYGTFKITFLSAEEAPQRLPQLKDQEVKLDRIMVKWISLDTIDVVITGCTIGERKTNQVVDNKSVTKTEHFLTNCTENFVDVPTCRFVYDRSTTRWAQSNHGKSVR